MKLYISINEKNEVERIKETIKSIDNCKMKICNNNLNSLKKADIVICNDDDIEKIESFFLLNKQVIIYRTRSELYNKIFNKKNVFTYSTINELSKIINYLQKKNKKTVAYISLLVVILFGIIGPVSYTKLLTRVPKNSDGNKTDIIEKKTISDKKIASLSTDIKKENYVFLGDSITYFYNLSMFYPNLPVINSGIGGYQTEDIIDNLQNSVYKYNPTKVFLLIGTNDIDLSDYSNEELADRIKYIVQEIKNHRSKTKIYVESIYPVNRDTDNNIVDLNIVKSRTNKRIQSINRLIEKMCDEEKNVEYINVYDKLTDDNGNLKLEYTRDGLHTNDAGYEVVTKILMTYIEEVENN